MELNKILYISQEIVPYLPSTPMAEHCLKLPQEMQERGTEVRTFMPKYGCIKERRNQLHEVIRLSGLNIIIDDADHPLIIKVATLQPARMQVYFIDNEDYFNRSQSTPELETTLLPADNDERILFYTRGVIETVKKLRWFPSVIHCSGWVTALAPLYLKTLYNDEKPLTDAKIVFSVFDTKFDGQLDPRFKEKLIMDGIPAEKLAAIESGADWKALNRLAVDYSDGIVQASPEIDSDLIEYIKNSGKPFLPYPGEEGFGDRYIEFYNSL